MKTIGFFDPNLSCIGHYKRFNRHLVRLFGSNEKIIFFDINNVFFDSFKDDIKNIEFITVSDKSISDIYRNAKTFSLKWFKALMNEFFWWKDICKKIEDNNIDILMISSLGYLSFFLIRPKVKYVTIITTNEIFFFKKQISFRYLLQRIKKRIILNFLAKAQGIFTLDEYLKNEISIFNFKNLDWIPDRCFEKNIVDGKSIISENFNMITPGLIYQGKNLEFVLDAYKQYNLSYNYVIAGKPVGEYGEKIIKEVEEMKNNFPITGIFDYLSESQYAKLIKQATFILLPYSSDRSGQISGVMYDAFENQTPIIAPDVRPFNYYINKYSLGLLYQPNDSSFIKTIEIASKMKKKSFNENFYTFKKDFLYSNVQKRASIILKKMIS